MAPWSVTWPFGTTGPELPESIEHSKGGSDTAFELFIDGALTKIYNEANGRSKEHRAIREDCKRVIESLREGRDGTEATRIQTPLAAGITTLVLEPLRLACASGNPKLIELALGCLHKLVSQAYLHAESTAAGKLDDGTIVAQVVLMVSKCGEQGGESIQLATLQALLTIATAEHFVVHGDCLMQTIRTAFNVAIGAESEQIKQTARNALLQMLNTVVKRVTQYPLSRLASAASSTLVGLDKALTVAADQLQQQTIPEDPSEGVETNAQPSTQDGQIFDESPSLSLRATADLQPSVAEESGSLGAQEEASTIDLGLKEEVPLDASHATSPETDPLPGGEAPAPGAEASSSQTADFTEEEKLKSVKGLGDTRTAQLATLAEQADLRGLEKALDQIQAERGQSAEAALQAERQARGLTRSDSAERDRDVRRVIMREKRQAAWRHLNLNERDVLTVLSAVCKMAARETGFGAVENLLHQGKLLALELLVRILENPLHSWSNVRPEFCDQLRQYLWPALLRNSLSPYREAFVAVTKLLAAILAQHQLRAGLKVEIGAFFPLMLLRPLEADRPDAVQQLAALEALKGICGNAALLIDIFVNYDCNLQASNLFERTLKSLARTIQLAPPPPAQPYAPGATPPAHKVRDTATEALLLLLRALDERAAPLKEVAEATATAESESTLGERQALHGRVLSRDPGLADRASEVARFGALKEKKHSLEAGILLFNNDAVKGMRSLLASGTVKEDPVAIASFLRQHKDALDTSQLGEYFGHHEELAISVMHAYIDQESYAGLAIDAALRALLKGFRLPGEAQKIDRIMEKFAERFCRDNEGAFASADSPYLLAFALIMLNTDAHNPRAEKKLGCEDFVTMCQVQDESGAFAPILPKEELEAMYGRILEQEIPLPSGAETARQEAGEQKRGVQASRLAAALGLSHLFRNTDWDKGHGMDVEHARLMQRTRELVAKGQSAEHVWHSASHIEHVRPMLQVGGAHVKKGLAAALDSAQDAGFAAPVLEGFAIAVRLAGMLDLDATTDGLLNSLAEGAAVLRPTQAGSAAEAKQLAAMSTLVSLASGPEAGFLGSGWVIVLRALSDLDLLKDKLTRNGQRGNFFGALPSETQANFSGNPQPSFVARPTPTPRSRSFGRGLLTRLGLSAESSSASQEQSKGEAPPSRAQPPAGTEDDIDLVPMADNAEAFFHGPGSVLVNWAEHEGQPLIEDVFTQSAILNGDAVVVFARALCAVSQEELVPEDPLQSPRMYSLGRLMESAYNNLGRIRLIWGRLWSAVAPHLVSAACHTDDSVAAQAVEHMQHLVARLLARAELSHFTYQEDALRPLVVVLKHSDSSNVREQVVALIAHSITAHPMGLGSGWKSILQALTVAAGDHSAAVVDAALDAAQAVVAALFRGVGVDAEYFGDVCLVLEVALRNPAHENLSVVAAGIFPAVAQRLANTDEKEWAVPLGGHASGLESPTARRRSSRPEAQPWARLCHAVGLAARHDPRPAVADAAAASLAEILAAHHRGWDEGTWGLFWTSGCGYMVELPQQTDAASNSTPVGWSVEGLARIQRQAAQHLPPLFECIQVTFEASRDVFRQVLDLLVSFVLQPREELAALGVELLHSMTHRVAPSLGPEDWHTVLEQFSLACCPELSSPLFRQQVGDHSAGGSSPGPTLLGRVLTPLEETRCLCATAVRMQRVCGAIIRECEAWMPASAQLHLLSILQDSVQRAAAFNRGSQKRLAASRLLHPEDVRPVRHANGVSSRAAQNGDLSVPDSGRAESSELSDEEGEHTASRPGDESAGGQDASAALIRQEAEGGMLLIELLIRYLPGGQRPGVATTGEAEKRLLGVSRRMLASAAQQSWPIPDALSHTSQHATSEAFAWDQAVRGPLLETVLGSYRAVSGEAWSAELPTIWPHLARLIASPQPAVRSALAALLHAQLPAILRSAAAA